MINGSAPVASSNATCLPEVLKDAALYFDPLDTDDMVKVIDKILSDKNLAQELGKKGHALAQSYSWKRMAQQTLDVYESVL